MKLREARPADREGILRIATHTWEGWDYVPLYLDEWTAEGGLFVYEKGGEILGITKTSELSPGELWFEAIRVAEEYRSMGLGLKIAEEQLELALERNPRSIRLSTADINTASLKIIRHLGFETYAAFDYYIKEARPTASAKSSRKEMHVLGDSKREMTAAWNLIQDCEEFRLSKRLFPHTWKFYEWTETFFTSIAEKRLIHVTDNVDGVLILIQNRYNPENLEIAFMDGNESSLPVMKAFARDKVTLSSRNQEVYAFAAGERKKSILKTIGFEPHKSITKVIVFDYPLNG